MIENGDDEEDEDDDWASFFSCTISNEVLIGAPRILTVSSSLSVLTAAAYGTLYKQPQEVKFACELIPSWRFGPGGGCAPIARSLSYGAVSARPQIESR